MATLIDSYVESNADAFPKALNSDNFNGTGQSFTGDGRNLTSAKFYIRRQGTPGGNLVAKLYAHTGTFGASSKGTGSALATSDTVSANSLSTSLALVEFTFSTPYFLDDGTKYVIHLEKDGEMPITSWTGLSNIVYVSTDETSSSHSGNWTTKIDDGSWTATSSRDTIFYVYGEDSGVPVTVTPSVESITASVLAVAVITSQILTLSPISAVFDIQPPSVSIQDSSYQPIGLLLALTKNQGGVNIAPSPVIGTFSVQEPSIVTDQVLSAGVQTSTFSVQSPTVIIPQYIDVDTPSATFAVNAVSVAEGVGVSPEVQTSTFSVQAPTVTTEQILSAGVQTATFSVLDPTVLLIDIARPDVVTGTFSLQAPTVTGEAIATAGIQTSTFSLQAPTVTVVTNVSADVQTLTLNQLAPTVTGNSLTSAGVQTLTFTIPDFLRAGSLWSNEDSNSSTWANGNKSATTWANGSKNSTTWANDSKNSSTWANESKNSSSWTNTDKTDPT